MLVIFKASSVADLRYQPQADITWVFEYITNVVVHPDVFKNYKIMWFSQKIGAYDIKNAAMLLQTRAFKVCKFHSIENHFSIKNISVQPNGPIVIAFSGYPNATIRGDI